MSQGFSSDQGLTDTQLRATAVPVSVSGVATASNQTTIIGHLDGVEGLLTTIDADTGNVSAKIDTLAGAVSGTEMQVDVLTLPALPTGTNNIGDVDVLTMPSDPFGANADAASATGSISAKLRFIANTGIPITGTVTVGSHAVSNAGTFAVQVDGAALTALQLLDDVVFTEDAGHTTADKGIQILTVRKDTAAALSGADVDYQPIITNARGATWVAIEDGAGGQITSFGGGTQYNEGDTDATITGTAILWEDSSDTLRVVSAAKPLPISGSVTASCSIDAHPLSEGTLLTSAVRSATTSTADETNPGYRGVMIYLNVTANGSGTLSVVVQGKDPVSGGYVNLHAINAWGAATGISGYVVGGAGNTSSTIGYVRTGSDQGLPLTWRVQVVHSGGTNWTYSLGYSYTH